nr:MAG TPA: hypothetical protein [Caudoviricetes sp.]
MDRRRNLRLLQPEQTTILIIAFLFTTYSNKWKNTRIDLLKI